MRYATVMDAEAARRERDAIRNEVLAAGFVACGFAPLVVDAATAARARAWIAAGYHGTMAWLAQGLEDRLRPAKVYTWAHSAMVVALAYDRPEPRRGLARFLSRYAHGRDYHNVMDQRLRRVRHILRSRGATKFARSVDAGPVLERALAAASGVGWVGKHGLILNADYGSMMFLAVVFTDLELGVDAPQTDHCGTCRACLDACPTGAFVAPYVLDARRCISYLNIEHVGAYTPPYDAPLHGWLQGCDACQEACPFVQAARRRARWGDPAFAPHARWADVTLAAAAAWNEAEWAEATRGTALRRGGFLRWQRVAQRLKDEYNGGYA